MINRTSIFSPKPGALLGIRVTNAADSTTHNWNFQLQRGVWVPGDRRAYSLKLEGQVIAAGPAEGIDQRLANQRASIDRLSNHLKRHCPTLLHGGPCEYGQ